MTIEEMRAEHTRKYLEQEEKREMREWAEGQIASALRGIERERKKYYKIEANREKKINAFYDRIAFASQKLIENKF